jgi:hypothetical protein
LSELLDKERQAHRNTKHEHETFLKTHHHTARTASQQEARVLELETARVQDRKKLLSLENSMKDQLTERNNLLLILWNRLSAICGTDWAHDNSLINGRALPSLEAVSTMLPGFSKNLLAAVRMIESQVQGFKGRIRTIEKELWKEYQGLEHALDQRTKKLERLEGLVKSGSLNSSSEMKTEILRLQDMNRMLRVELAALRAASPRKVSMDLGDVPSPSPSVPTGPRNKSMDRSTLTRTQSTSAVESLDRAVSSSSSFKGAGDEAGEQRWIYRLKELERRLKAEREARLLDRSGARKRLEEGERRNRELQAELERGKVRKELEGAE